MKVFVNGTNHIKKNEGKWILPESVTSYLDELMENNAEILVEDQQGAPGLVQDYLESKKYNAVTVCVAGNKNWRFYNAGNWSEKYFCVHGEARVDLAGIEKDFGMAEEADLGLTIWEGEDFGTFLDMLCLCALGKPVRLYLINENRWIDVNSIEDIREFKGPDEELSEDEIFEVMTCCKVPVETIRNVVKEDDEYVYRILLDCINQADIALEKKLELLKLLSAKQNMNYEVFRAVERAIKLEKSWKLIKHDIRAIADLRPVGYGEAEIPWKEIRQKWYEIDKIVNPRKYAKYIVFDNKKTTFE